MRALSAAALATAAWLAGASAAQACRCIEPEAPVAYRAAGVVALVRVTEASAPGAAGAQEAVAAVERAWKAPLGPVISLATGGDCPFLLEAGGRYLLFLAPAEGAAAHAAYRCRGNQPGAAAGPALRWLAAHGRRTR